MNKMRKVLFLDVDGVLNSEEFLLREKPTRPLDERWFCPEMVARLDTILAESKALIVLSSTWRLLHRIPDVFGLMRKQGLKHGHIIDVTPHLGGPRGDEIQAWLDRNAHSFSVDRCVILDDDGDMSSVQHRLVQTTWKRGLQDEHVDQALALFGISGQMTLDRFYQVE